MTRANVVTCIAAGVAIGAAAHTIAIKHQAEAAIEAALKADPSQAKLATTLEQLEKLKTRYCLIQAWASGRGIFGDQPSPDDGLTLPGIYPQLIYDPTAAPHKDGVQR